MASTANIDIAILILFILLFSPVGHLEKTEYKYFYESVLHAGERLDRADVVYILLDERICGSVRTSYIAACCSLVT